MQDRKFMVSSDGKSISLDGCLYNCVDSEISGVMRCSSNGDLILFQQHAKKSVRMIQETRIRIAARIFPEKEGIQINENNIEEYERRAMAGIRLSRDFHFFIWPCSYAFKYSSDHAEIFTVSKLPDNFTDKYYKINRAVSLQNFSLHARVLAALNLADAALALHKYFNGLLCSIDAGAVFVNIENGDIKIVLERCLDSVFTEDKFGENGDCFFSCKATYSDLLNEGKLLRFAEYAAFRFLCVDDPFDGADTLIQFPYLSKNAVSKMHSDYAFIFSDSSNSYSEYIGKNAAAKWKNLPVFMQTAFRQAFETTKEKPDPQMNLEEWLKQMRKLRDCLVLANNQFKLCDPLTAKDDLFLEIGDYIIPAWNKKAVYWYHAGIDYDHTANGIVGGIDAERRLVNRTQLRWKVIDNTDYNDDYDVNESFVKLKAGIKIWVENTCINVLSGEDLRKKDREPEIPFEANLELAANNNAAALEDNASGDPFQLQMFENGRGS